MKQPPRVVLRKLDSADPKDVTDLQRVLESAPAYWRRISAKTIDPEAAETTLAVLPAEKSYDDKFVFGIMQDAQMIGCADIIRGFPNRETAMLGLLLIGESRQKTGAGRASYRAIENLVLSWAGIQRIRIGVIGTNSVVLPFWSSMGFSETGVRHPYAENGVVSETLVLEKVLRAPVS